MKKLDIVVFGLSITSSWGNGHATTFRSLIKALAARGHRITFFEKDVPWYANQRDMPSPPFCKVVLYKEIRELEAYEEMIGDADMVILGSYVSDAKALAARICQLEPACLAFYDIDTPVTLAKLRNGDYEYLSPEMIPRFDLYLSFTGGPTLDRLEYEFGARRARPLYCSVDTDLYFPSAEDDAEPATKQYALGYLGTYSDDRQPTVEQLLIKPARQLTAEHFCVAGAQYPAGIDWPANVSRIEHIPPHQHREFYGSQRFTLNVTRRDMIAAGYSPSVRLFEAGACGTPVISDEWDGLDSFFAIGEEILTARSSEEVQSYLTMPATERQQLGERFRSRVLNAHTSRHRAMELENSWAEVAQPSMAAS
ncbi:MAG: glycosyltransferase [unclassified Hahellaceae]|nr:glycosyltransferase [Hahellaceae bacterium]|tara:strand:+ start:113956 stop:115056 length:1101 start_codon:yes stop_codon:yes gene_type:complete